MPQEAKGTPLSVRMARGRPKSRKVRSKTGRAPRPLVRRVLAAVLRIGWVLKRSSGSHKTLARGDWPDYVFSFHDSDEIGPRMLARIAKRTGLKPEDL